MTCMAKVYSPTVPTVTVMSEQGGGRGAMPPAALSKVGGGHTVAPPPNSQSRVVLYIMYS